ncbi:MAG TPA: SMP-30/gluconolactonase/LRE family protein [Bryobacteraceae bacterium]|nr:SMP-30/gluconolactonase/LRE family protein [Bryobacteraceae bacterium]
MSAPADAKSPALLDLTGEQTVVEKLCTGFQFVEGPIWNPREQCLYFSDIPASIRYRWAPGDGNTTEARNPTNRANGMTYDGDLNLYICEHNTNSLVCESPAGERRVVASHWQGKELNSPNDVVVRADGSVYFSDPSYGRDVAAVGLERAHELTFQGVFRVSPDGELHLEADDFGQPNGLCFSPDEKLLYVDDTPRARIRVFDVAPDGSLRNSRILAANIGDGEIWHGVVDGMKCDERGNIYVTGPRGIWIFSPAGEHLGIIDLPEHIANLNWGGPDWDELYCACFTSIYRVKMRVRGNPVAYMRAC